MAPHGQPGNPGTRTQPLDLTTALSATSPARPGDTIWLLGGTYTGTFTSRLTGTAAAPITVRQYPGQRATLDGAGSPRDVLTTDGAWTVFWGFEITNSNTRRLVTQPGPWPTDLTRGAGVSARGPNMKFINLVIHDLSNGIGLWSESVGSEVYGTLLFHNGWEAPDGSHGHGLYTQNASGVRQVRENIAFNQFSHGLHAYGSSSAYLNDIVLEGNVAFNNGILGTSGFERDILLGGGIIARNPVLRQNFTYGGAQTNVGYAAGCTNGRATDNYLMGSSPVLLVNCVPVMTGNVFYSLQAERWGWGGLDTAFPANTFHARRPTTNVVRVRPNQFEPGRAHVIVYNWQRQAAVTVDLSGAGLQPGQAFEVRDAQNFYGAPVVRGVYAAGATISLPMQGLAAQPPVGQVPVLPPHTAPDFGVFVVMRSTDTPVDPPVATPVLAPGGGTFSAPVSVTITSTTPGATIRYTTDGSTPSSGSAVYATPIAVSSNTVIRAQAFASGRDPSAVASETYVVQQGTIAAPVISPAGGTITGPTSVAITSATAGAVIRVTQDGSTPTSASPLYSGPVTVSTSVTVRARAFASGLPDSAVTTAVFTRQTTADSPPAISWLTPAEGARLGGTAALSVNATDDRGIARVEFFVDGRTVATSTAAPYSVSWNTLDTGDGTHQITATAVDSSGQRTTTPARTILVKNRSTTAVTIRLEAEAGALVRPMTIANTPTASGGRYAGNSTDNQGTLTLPFTLPRAGSYRIWLRQMSPGADSVLVSIDGGAEDVHAVPAAQRSYTWQWAPVRVSPDAGAATRQFTLAAGAHNLRVRTGRAVTRLDAIVITSEEAVIADQPDPSLASPTGLHADRIVDDLVTLRWTPPAGPVAPEGYVLEGGVVPGSTLAVVPVDGASSAFTFRAPSGAFHVRLHAVAGTRRSAASNEIQVFSRVPQVPSPPVNLLGLADGSTLALAWKNSYAGGAPTSLRLDVSGAMTTSIPIGLADRFDFADVPPGTYTLRLVAVNDAGASEPSEPVSLSFPSACAGRPDEAAAFQAHVSGRSVTVSWDSPDLGPAPTGYVLHVNGAATASIATGERTLSGTLPPGEYQLRVVTTNACGEGPASPVRTIIVN
ncbi:MAG: chitobiase/beta-hexosaminidase C-terminal domain-containing protein [Acidobacteria bacterium]|nr:chitobiase/beta-hexosaminidase C-terminal domain-containing protein [Acidobacteriota bacterium]